MSKTHLIVACTLILSTCSQAQTPLVSLGSGSGNADLVLSPEGTGRIAYSYSDSVSIFLGKYLWTDSTTSSNGVLEMRNAGSDSGDDAFIRFVRSRGTISSPIAVSGGNLLGAVSAIGYDGSNFSAHSDSAILFQANQTFSPANHATEIIFQNTQESSTSKINIARLTGRDLIIGDAAQTVTSMPGGGIGIKGVYMGNNGATFLMMDAYGNGGGDNATIIGRRAHGTIASPSASVSGDNLVSFSGRGYGSTGFSSGARALISLNASQDWTDSNQGTYISLGVTPNNSTTRTEAVRICQDGQVVIRNSKTPASASDTGTAGTICWDTNYIYVCIATNTWKRTLLSSW